MAAAVEAAAVADATEIATRLRGCSAMDDADGPTTRTSTAVDISQVPDPGARRSHRTSSARAKALKPTEGQLHATVAELLDWILLPPAIYTTFPAGWGMLGPATAGRLKKSGLKPGMPDILVFCSGRTVGLELKAPGKTTSPIQDAMFAKLRGAGVRVYICDCVADVIAALNEVGFPFRYVHPDDGRSLNRSVPLRRSYGG